MVRRIQELDLNDRTVFVRVDFNVPMDQGKITETHRIEATLPTLRFILPKAKKLLLATHLGRPGGRRVPEWSLGPIRDHLERFLSHPVVLAPDCIGAEVEALVQDQSHKLILLENLRFHTEEENNDPAFAQALAALAQVYVNDAFGAAHRAHASISGMVSSFSAKGAGFLLQKEIEYLSRALSAPDRPFVALLGGAKVSDKIGMLKNLLPRVDTLLIGGAMAYTFLRSKGIPTGKSLVEEDRIPLARELLSQAERLGKTLLLPIDHMAATKNLENPILSDLSIPPDYVGLDIGPKTAAQYQHEISNARMVLWNGPVGRFEVAPFDQGTRIIAKSLAETKAVTIVGGGETVAAIRQARLEDKITHISTGGGATLEFLEGKKLPGIEALEEQP